jgi:hypothetical protein
MTISISQYYVMEMHALEIRPSSANGPIGVAGTWSTWNGHPLYENDIHWLYSGIAAGLFGPALLEGQGFVGRIKSVCCTISGPHDNG